MLELGTGWILGILLGLRHALEPDHLAAVSTLLPEERGVCRGALLGASWGVGHTLALLVVGAILGALHAELPARVSDLFELAVAFMLIALGVRAVGRAYREGRHGPYRPHLHGQRRHAHAGPVAHVHLGRLTLARRPLLVGFVHGLAGSGALAALALAGLPSPLARLGFTLLFGVGSIAGMALLAGLAAWPLGRLRDWPRAARALGAAAGTASAALGMLWGYPLAARILG